MLMPPYSSERQARRFGKHQVSRKVVSVLSPRRHVHLDGERRDGRRAALARSSSRPSSSRSSQKSRIGLPQRRSSQPVRWLTADPAGVSTDSVSSPAASAFGSSGGRGQRHAGHPVGDPVGVPVVPDLVVGPVRTRPGWPSRAPPSLGWRRRRCWSSRWRSTATGMLLVGGVGQHERVVARAVTAAGTPRRSVGPGRRGRPRRSCSPGSEAVRGARRASRRHPRSGPAGPDPRPPGPARAGPRPGPGPRRTPSRVGTPCPDGCPARSHGDHLARPARSFLFRCHRSATRSGRGAPRRSCGTTGHSEDVTRAPSAVGWVGGLSRRRPASTGSRERPAAARRLPPAAADQTRASGPGSRRIRAKLR